MTAKMKRFADNYIHNGFCDISKAARDAGYSAKSARAIGSETLQKPDVQKYIKSQIKKLMTSRDKMAYKLLKIIEHATKFDIRNLLEWDEKGNIKMKPSDQIDELDAVMISGLSQMRDGSIKLKIVQKEKAWDRFLIGPLD